MRIWTLLILALGLTLASCAEPRENGATRETVATQQLQEQASVVVGMPGITLFQEKRLLKTIYELRDQANLVTYTYYLDLQGQRHKVCPTTSIGFPIPYATQYTEIGRASCRERV